MSAPGGRILVPIDDSPHARHALAHALTVAREIHIVNVQPKADAPALLLHMTQDQIDAAQRQHGEEALAAACKRLDETGRTYRRHVLIGDPASEIARVAREEKVDGIVMGTRGMSAIGNLLLGSTATRVVHLADVPVTLVK